MSGTAGTDHARSLREGRAQILGATAAERVTGATLARDTDGRPAIEVPPQSARVLAFTAG